MAVLARLSVPVSANTSGFARDLARATKLAESWSSKLGGRVDAALGGAGRGAGPLGKVAGYLDAIGKGTGLARVALAGGDVYRSFKAVGNVMDRVRLGFTTNARAAGALRERIGATSARLHDMRRASVGLRMTLFKVDLAAFGAKLGVLAAKTIPGAVAGFAQGAYGVARFTGGVAEAVGGVAMFVPNVARMTKSLYGAATAAKGSAKQAVDMFAAYHYGGRALGSVLGLTRGLAAMTSGTISAASGALQFGGSLAKVGWNAAVSGTSAIAKGLYGIATATLSAAAGMTKVTALGGVLAGVLGYKAAASAASLEQTLDKTRQLFGPYADEAIRTAKAMEDAYAINQQPFLEGATAIQSMLKGMGYAAGDASKLGVGLSRLAADSKAFRDIGLDEALAKIRSGLAGETEPLMQFGIDLREGAVNAYAYSNGIAAMNTQLTGAQQTQARLGLITRGLADDMGALGREATGPAARISEFWGRLETLQNTIGASLAPALGSALGVVNAGVLALTDSWGPLSQAALGFWNDLTGTVYGFISGAGGGVLAWGKAVFDFFELAGVPTAIWNTALGVIGNTLQGIGLVWKGVSSGILNGIGKLLGGFSYLAGGIDSLLEKAGLTPTGAGDYIARLAEKTQGLAQMQADAFGEAFQQQWGAGGDALVAGVNGAVTGMASGLTGGTQTMFANITRAYEDALAKIERSRAELTGPPDLRASAAPKSPFEAAAKAGKGKDPFAAFAARNSKEDAAITLRTKHGGGEGKAVEKTAQNTEKIVWGVNKVADNFHRMPEAIGDVIGRKIADAIGGPFVY